MLRAIKLQPEQINPSTRSVKYQGRGFAIDTVEGSDVNMMQSAQVSDPQKCDHDSMIQHDFCLRMAGLTGSNASFSFLTRRQPLITPRAGTQHYNTVHDPVQLRKLPCPISVTSNRFISETLG